MVKFNEKMGGKQLLFWEFPAFRTIETHNIHYLCGVKPLDA